MLNDVHSVMKIMFDYVELMLVYVSDELIRV